MSNTSADIKIASEYGSGTNWYGSGTVDDVRIYDRALSAGEIAAIAANRPASAGGGTFELQDALDVGNDLILTTGELDVSYGNNYAVTVDGDWLNTIGIFAPQQGTVTLDGSTQAITGSQAYYNLTKSVSSADTLTIDKDETVMVLNTLTLSGTDAASRLTIDSSDSTNQFIFDVLGGNQTADWVDVANSAASKISGTMPSLPTAIIWTP